MMSASPNNNFLVICFCVLLFFSLDQLVQAAVPVSTEKDVVKVGVIIDQNSTVGKMASRYIHMALSDFYEEHEGYRTRLSPCARDPKNDVVAAASAALDLIENEQVHAIIGPQWSSQAKFVSDLGAIAHVPIISFSATSPSLSPTQNQYFVRTAYDDIFQVKAISAIVQAFGWRKVVLIYEDTDYGNGLVPYIMDAFQEIDTRVPFKSVIPPSAQEFDILNKLVEVMTMQTRVFLVHMTASLGSRLFMQAKKAGMLNEETVWIVTDGLTSLLDPVEHKAIKSMQGVIGVRPHLHRSKRLVRLMKKYSLVSGDINLFGLWAYDTVWALGDAVEKAWNSSKFRHSMGTTTRSTPNAATAFMNFSALGISEVGPEILQWMRNSTVNGLTGQFHLRNGQLSHSAFEVFNVVGHKEQVIGYWTTKYGLCRKIPNRHNKQEKGYSTCINDLQAPIWPGGTRKQPRGWVMPAVKGSKMRIGVPLKSGFTEFFKIEWDTRTEVPKYSGFSYDVFLEVLKRLPFAIEYEFMPFVNASQQSAGTYNDMLNQIKLGVVDAVVGDTTNIAERSTKVDFTSPYLQSGVSMLVAIKDDERRNMWIFLKPLKWDLWLTTGLAFVFTGFVVWTLERRKNEDFNGSPSEQLGRSLWFSFSTLVFAHREKVTSNWTRLVLVIWVFVVLILTQSYTASLASFLTVQRLQPKYIDAGDLVRSQHFVGYQKGSFVRDFLILEMNFSETRLIPYGSTEEYHDALSRGSGNGGVAAIFDEIPYINLFLAKYCSKFTMVGPTYKTAGLSFAFPMGSPLVSYVSRAVLNVTQDKATMDPIERNYFPTQTSSCQDTTDRRATISSDLSLSVYSFSGLFIVTGVASLSAILAEFFYSKWRRLSSPAQITSGVPTNSS